MTFTPVSQANPKTAEFARLFDLFDRVASRRARALAGDSDASEAISADDIANVPAEFAPVLKNLSTILSLRVRRDEEHARRAQGASTTNTCHDTPGGVPTAGTTPTTESAQPRASTVEPSDPVEEDLERLSFPLGSERYPFTFKLMLHKLYDIDEWAEKVRSAVETSKSQFKPIAEQVQNIVRDATVTIKEREERSGACPALGVSAKFRPQSVTRQSRSTATSRDAAANTKERRDRSGVRPALGASAKFRPPSTTRHARSTTMSVTEREVSRAVKKRCIGRRKSISGPMSTRVWVYDAAISATEIAGPHPAVEITLSAPNIAGGMAERRARHRSLTALEEIQTRDTAGRKAKITVSIPHEEGVRSLAPQPSQVSQEIMEMQSIERRKSMASLFTPELCKRVAVKRPLCV